MGQESYPRESTRFGAYIRKLRQEQFPDISLNSFAGRIGISGSYLSYIETGKVPPPSSKVVIKLAQELGVGREYLLAMAGQPNPEMHALLTSRKYAKVRELFMETRLGKGSVRYDFPEIAASLMGYRRDPLVSTSDLLRVLADLVELMEKQAGPEITPDLVRAALIGMLNYLPRVEQGKHARHDSEEPLSSQGSSQSSDRSQGQ